MNHVGTADLGCPAERSSAVNAGFVAPPSRPPRRGRDALGTAGKMPALQFAWAAVPA